MAPKTRFGMWLGQGSWPSRPPFSVNGDFAMYGFYKTRLAMPEGFGFRWRGGFEGFAHMGTPQFDSIIKSISQANTVCADPRGFISTNLNPRLEAGSEVDGPDGIHNAGGKLPIPYTHIIRGDYDQALRQDALDTMAVDGLVYIETGCSEINIGSARADAQGWNPDSIPAVGSRQPGLTKAQAVQNTMNLLIHEATVFHDVYQAAGATRNYRLVVSIAGQQASKWIGGDAEDYITPALQWEADPVRNPQHIPVIDVIGLDWYSGGGRPDNRPTDIEPTRLYAAAHGKSAGVFECGVHPTGARKADWFNPEYVNYMAANGGQAPGKWEVVMFTASEGYYWPEEYVLPENSPQNGYGSPSWIAFNDMAHAAPFTTGDTSRSGPVVLSGGGQLTASGIRREVGPAPGYPDQRQLPRKRLTLRSE